MMLPNGYVYGEQVSSLSASGVDVPLLMFQALEEMARQNNGQVICPKTKEVFPYRKVEKVFVM